MASNKPRAQTFDAGAFGSLRYDFTAYGGATGIIPDPSDDLLEKFNTGYRDLLAEYGLDTDTGEVDSRDPESVNAALERTEGVSFVEQQRRMVDLIADLCQDSPSAEQIMRLPFRVRQRYIVWLQNNLTNPEA